MEREFHCTLAALDLDGTLLNSSHEISPAARSAIQRILDGGNHVVLATGRAYSEMASYLGLFHGLRYVICGNGSCVYDAKNQEAIFYRPLSPALIGQVIRAVEGEDVLVSFFIGGRVFMSADMMDRLEGYGLTTFRGVFERSGVFLEDLFSFYRENPLDVEKVNIFFPNRERQNAEAPAPGSLRARMTRRIGQLPVSAAPSGNGNLEVTAAGVDKGSALRLLCEHLRVPMEEVLAMGDSGNDAGMLRAAGFPVVMGNASLQIQALGRVVAPDCDHDGAARILEQVALPAARPSSADRSEA